MPKGPQGSTNHGVCLLRGSGFVGDYILGFDDVSPRVNFGPWESKWVWETERWVRMKKFFMMLDVPWEFLRQVFSLMI